MRFYRYLNTGERGYKRITSTQYTPKEVREDLLKITGKYAYLPVYQDRGKDFRPLFTPSGWIDSIDKLEDFLRPKTNTFVWEDSEWKIKIYTPEHLLDFYESFMDENKNTNRFVQNIENIKKSNLNYEDYELNELGKCIDTNSSAFRFGIFQGALMEFQMRYIEKTGGILISKDLSYRFLDEPCEQFEIKCTVDSFEFPEHMCQTSYLDCDNMDDYEK